MPLEASSAQFCVGKGGSDDGDASRTMITPRATNVQANDLVTTGLKV